MMESDPGDFETYFYCGVKVTCSSDFNVKFIDSGGRIHNFRYSVIFVSLKTLRPYGDQTHGISVDLDYFLPQKNQKIKNYRLKYTYDINNSIVEVDTY